MTQSAADDATIVGQRKLTHEQTFITQMLRTEPSPQLADSTLGSTSYALIAGLFAGYGEADARSFWIQIGRLWTVAGLPPA
jgi:hypothetical protein